MKSESFEGWNNFDIMETDYVNYAVMYQCQTKYLGASTFQKMWVLVRQPTPVDSNLWREYKRVAFKAIERGFINQSIGLQFASEKVMVRKHQGGATCTYPSDPVVDKMNGEQQKQKPQVVDESSDDDQVDPFKDFKKKQQLVQVEPFALVNEKIGSVDSSSPNYKSSKESDGKINHEDQ